MVGVLEGAVKVGTAGGPVGGKTGKCSSDPVSLSMSLSSASFRSLKADFGTLGTSSRNVLTSAKSNPNTSANLELDRFGNCSKEMILILLTRVFQNSKLLLSKKKISNIKSDSKIDNN